MNLLYGKVVEVFDEDEVRTARVRVAGVVRRVPIDLVADAQSGDEILICDGVAIGKANPEKDYVSGDPR